MAAGLSRGAGRGFLTLCMGSLLTVGVSCSFFEFEHDACTSNRQCQDGFGYGMTCSDAGYCRPTQTLERCVLSDESHGGWPLSTDEFVLIGSLFNRSNATHLARAQSARLAIDQVNENGGFGGKEVLLMECTNADFHGADGQDRHAATEEISTWLASEVGVPAILGPSSSTQTELAYYAASELGTLVVSPAATSTTLTDLDGLQSTDDDPGLLWRTAAPDDLQARLIAEDIVHRENLSTAVIHQSGAYGEGLASAFQAEYDALGGTAFLYPYATTSARDGVIAAVGDESAYDEVLFISSDPEDISDFLNSAALLDGYQSMAIFLPDSGANDGVLSGAYLAADLFDQIRGTVPVPPEGLIYDTFVTSYAGAYGGQDVHNQTYTANAFDAAWLVLYGMAWSQFQSDEITGVGIARGLRRVSGGPLVEIRASNWNKVRAYFEAGQAINVEGASGSLDYDPKLGETTTVIGIWQVNETGDGIEIIQSIDP